MVIPLKRSRFRICLHKIGQKNRFHAIPIPGIDPSLVPRGRYLALNEPNFAAP